MKTIFPNLFKTRHKYRVILKSGNEFRITATNIEIKWKTDTCELTAYSFTDAKGEVPFHIAPKDIEAILKIR